MTQQLHKQQGFDRQPCEILDIQSNHAVQAQRFDREFNALDLELKHSQDYQNNESEYIEYEIDSVVEEFGELFRLWNGRTLLGTFYKTSEEWKVTPFYLCKQYIKAERDLSQSFEDSEEAIAYIKSMYKGRNLVPEKIYSIAA